MLQWDLLNVWSRFEKSGKVGPDVLVALAKAVAACGQSAEVLSTLPDGLADLRAKYSGGKPGDRRASLFACELALERPELALGRGGPEILRPFPWCFVVPRRACF